MAGDWIKMRADLFTHPKVVRMSSALEADTLRTVGGLMSVWCLFDVHSVDGELEGYTFKAVDDHLRWAGFSSAMCAVGWIKETEKSLVLPEFDTHNGQSAKRRAQDADRKKEVRKVSAPQADKLRTREEKRREEITVTDVTGDKSPTDRDLLFATGVPLLTASGVSDKNARSMLAGLAKKHGDSIVADAIRQTAFDRPVEPVSWLQSLMPSTTNGKPNSQEALEASNRAVVERYFKNKATHAPQ